MSMRQGHFKVAFFGGMANNTYLAASQLHTLNIEVVYIRDHVDKFAISQPIWEEHSMTLPHDDLNASSQWSSELWDQIAQRAGWKPPNWLVDPLQCDTESEPDFRLLRIDPAHFNYTPAPADHYRKILSIMQSCDLVFVSNVYAIILAMMSNRPYVICPAGGELMVGSGLISGEGAVGVALEQQRRLMIKGFAASKAVLTNTPYFQHRSLTGGWWNLIKNFPRSRFKRVSLPFSTTPQLKSSQKKSLLRDMTNQLGLNPITTEYCLFIPSRIDYRWKGQNIIAEALYHHPHRDRFTLIVSGWGVDYAHFRERYMTSSHNIRVMKCVMSKPLLRNMYRATDLTIDQIMLGHIGTAAREAAAVGSPVMAWIDGKPLLHNMRPEMPVLNAHSEAEVTRWLTDIAEKKIDLLQEGKRAQDWIKKYASAKTMAQELRKIIEEST